MAVDSRLEMESLPVCTLVDQDPGWVVKGAGIQIRRVRPGRPGMPGMEAFPDLLPGNADRAAGPEGRRPRRDSSPFPGGHGNRRPFGARMFVWIRDSGSGECFTDAGPGCRGLSC